MKEIFVTIFVAFLKLSAAERILMWIPTPSISHQVVFRPWTQELARRGHEVIVITTDPAFPKGQTPPNLIEIDVHDISYKLKNEHRFMNSARGVANNDMFRFMHEVLIEIIEMQLNTTEVQDIIFGDEKFDLLILEAYLRPILALSHLFKAPIIQTASLRPSFENLDVIGAPSNPIVYPSSMKLKLYNLTLWEKIKEIQTYYNIFKTLNDLEDTQHRSMQKYFGINLPQFGDLFNNVDMLFLNSHKMFFGNRPVPQSVVNTWGLYKKPENDLPEDLKSYLDNSIYGVIYMSFGTNTNPSQLPTEIINVFMKVFCELQFNVLLKWDKEDIPGQCKNIRIGKWFPQSDLLRHPNIKMFVTQGGLQSIEEAISSEVPVVGIPMLLDQYINVEMIVDLNVGIKLDAKSISEKSFKDAILAIIENRSYKTNIRKLNKLMKDDPMPALERVVWWTEHVLRHGGIL